MIRPANIHDINAVIQLGKGMHTECWQRWMPYSEERLVVTLHSLVESGFLWVHEQDGEIDGAMAGFVAECWYASVKVAGEMGLYVRPGLSGGIIAMRLVKRFIQWATEQGAAEITLGVSTGVNIHETGLIYERLGFEHVGGNYKMRVNHVHGR